MKTVVLSCDLVIGGQRRVKGEIATVPDDFPDAQVGRVLTRSPGGHRGGDGRLGAARGELSKMIAKERRRAAACGTIEGKKRARRDWRGMGRARDLKLAHETFAKNLDRKSVV